MDFLGALSFFTGATCCDLAGSGVGLTFASAPSTVAGLLLTCASARGEITLELAVVV